MDKIIAFTINNKKIVLASVIWVILLSFISFLIFLPPSTVLTQTNYEEFSIAGTPIIGYVGEAVEVEKTFFVENENIDTASFNIVDFRKEFELIKGINKTQLELNEENNIDVLEKIRTNVHDISSRFKNNLAINKIEVEELDYSIDENSYSITRNTRLLKKVDYDPNDTFESRNFTNYQHLGEFHLTYYCPCELCCEKPLTSPDYGFTATGTNATEGRTIAVDPTVIPYGSKVYIEGLGIFIAEDCGGAIKQNRIDVFKQYHSECYDMILRDTQVYIIED